VLANVARLLFNNLVWYVVVVVVVVVVFVFSMLIRDFLFQAPLDYICFLMLLIVVILTPWRIGVLWREMFITDDNNVEQPTKKHRAISHRFTSIVVDYFYISLTLIVHIIFPWRIASFWRRCSSPLDKNVICVVLLLSLVFFFFFLLKK
jgi:hypothetical protein